MAHRPPAREPGFAAGPDDGDAAGGRAAAAARTIADMSARPARRPLAASLLCLGVGCGAAGCGGEEPVVTPAAGGGNVAANPAPAPRAAPAAPSRRREPRRPKAAIALPVDAARYEQVAAAGDGETKPDRPNFRLAGSAPPVGAGTFRTAADAGDRFGVDQLPAAGDPPAVSLPAGLRAVASAGAGPGGLPRRIVCEADDMPLALVPAGIVRIAGGESADGRAAFVSDFYMDRHEVTVGQFARFLQSADGRGQGPPMNVDAPADHPAVGVPWRAAYLYARWCGRSLPTEAEWQRAAAGDAHLPAPWGTGRTVFGRRREPGQIAAVGSFRTDRGPFGVFDLAGNAPEWTAQRWLDDPLARDRPDAAGLYRDPDGGSGPGGDRLVKGLGDGWLTSRRAKVESTDTAAGVGFRCVWRPTEDGEPGSAPLFGGTR